MVTVLDNVDENRYRQRVVVRTILVCMLLGCLTACGSRSNGRLQVVASTNVYGDIARQIGGSHVSVTSVLTDPNADPHLFEPGTSNGLAVSHASVVIENGLAYDAFMTRLERAAPNDKRRVLTIADVLGIHGRDANPHLWYDVLALGDTKHASAYGAGLRRFVTSLGPLERAVASIRRSHAGAPVAYTEPVPG